MPPLPDQIQQRPGHLPISRRKAKLGKVPFYQDKQKTPLHILIDSSGLAVHAGQLRRAPNSRDYRKLHLCVDEQTGEVVACELTSKRARDSSRVASLVGQIDSPISSARADTAYDAGGVYEAIENHSAHRSPRVLIPPRKGALLASEPASSRQRNRNIAAQARLGKRKWHTESGYSKRSKVETTFHRYSQSRVAQLAVRQNDQPCCSMNPSASVHSIPKWAQTFGIFAAFFFIASSVTATPFLTLAAAMTNGSATGLPRNVCSFLTRYWK